MMSITTNDLPRTVEIMPAKVQTTGKLAGLIEVSMIIGDSSQLNCDISELYLKVDGENHLLRLAGRKESDRKLQLTFFSNHVRETHLLPTHIQLIWGDTCRGDECGMELTIRKVAGEIQ